MMDYKFPSDYWRLCDDVTLVQAALLILDIEPEGIQERVLDDVSFGEPIKPKGFDTVLAALQNAIVSDRLKANTVKTKKRLPTEDNEGAPAWMDIETDNLDFKKTTISVADLKHWLIEKGAKGKFFFPNGVDYSAPYLDPLHRYYAPKLAATIQAWMAVTQDESSTKGLTPRMAIEEYLTKNSARLGLIKDDGEINQTAIEEMSRVANWDSGGGVPSGQRKIRSKKS